MRDFKQLKVWEEAHELTLEIYRVTKSYPKDELFSLISQMRQSGSSIPTNIAEGCGRETNAELTRAGNFVACDKPRIVKVRHPPRVQ